jgi:hypothetical protein
LKKIAQNLHKIKRKSGQITPSQEDGSQNIEKSQSSNSNNSNNSVKNKPNSH